MFNKKLKEDVETINEYCKYLGERVDTLEKLLRVQRGFCDGYVRLDLGKGIIRKLDSEVVSDVVASKSKAKK